MNGAGFTLWFTGMSGTGKSTLSAVVAQRLRDAGARVELLDGDVLRTHLCRDLGFSRADREENIRRIGFVCDLLCRHGVIAIVAAISPYRASREEVRSRVPNFVEVYMRCPMDVLIQRDVKGLYKKALAGEISHFTGISDPYEPPVAPEATIDSSSETPEQGVAKVLEALERAGVFVARTASTPGS
jgi:adenylyl-sulfate kinase